METIAILGSTGSIGRNCLEVIASMPGRFKVTGLAARSNLKELKQQIERFSPKYAVVWNKSDAGDFKRSINGNVKILSGIKGLKELASDKDTTTVVNALVGAVGLVPTIEALKAGKKVALANKETLVIGGELINPLLGRNGCSLLPVDSEHSALHQCLHGCNPIEVERLILTASGGPFLRKGIAEFDKITVNDALKHPTWNMGKKITIDSATLMNKGLEVIEAHFLFHVPYNKIQVIIHPQSIIHSMAQFVDGSIIAQLGPADMKIPIQYALTYPQKKPLGVKRIDFTRVGRLDFERPDIKKFPCLGLAYEAGRRGGSVPAVMNASNEVAVDRFLAGKIKFRDIPKIIESAINAHKKIKKPTLGDILETDRETRERINKIL